MEEYSVDDPTQLLQAASDFAHYPGILNENSVKEFLDRFPLPVIINTLQTKAETPQVQTTLAACLERIFETKYGASLIPQYMVGLRAESQDVRYLACKTVSFLLRNVNDKVVSPYQLLIAHDVYPLLLDCLVNWKGNSTGDERVAAASMDAIKIFAASPEGIATIFPADSNEMMDLRNVAARSSPLGRVRVLSLIAKLFSISHSVASVIYSSGLLGLMEAEIRNSDDILVKLNVLELIFELAEMEHGAEFLSKTTLLQLLSSIISISTESVLRSRAMMITGRILSKQNMVMFNDESSLQPIISAIESNLKLPEPINADEYECALEAIATKGAELLFSISPNAVKYVIDAAFDRQRRGMQLAALHSLGNIVGENRSESSKMLNDSAEELLRRQIYDAASQSSKLVPSGLFLSVLQQDTDVRQAGYTLISNLVVRPCCLMEICSKQEIINIVTDAYHETTKIGMDARYNSCLAISKALTVSTKVKDDSRLAAIVGQIQEAVRRGPYLAQRQPEARPTITTEQRF
ncbi:hypothetical protein V2J09_023703 [Rumex salicifolius]